MIPTYKLTPLALEDLKTIWRYGAETWGLEQTEAYGEKILDAFEFLAENPQAGLSVESIRAGYKRHPVWSHLIFYQVVENCVEVVRILHQRMYIERQLKH